MDTIMSNTSSCLLALAAVVPVYLAWTAVYNVYLSPLRNIPGPWYAAVSPLWINIETLKLRQCRSIEKLFEKYGPVVRLGPNYVAFCDLNAMKSVYGATSKFDKGVWYKALLTNEHDHAMTTLPSGEHLQKKRGFAPHYAVAHINLHQPEMHDSTLELVHRLEEIAGKTSVDTLSLFRSLMVDVIYNTTYGENIRALSKWGTNTEDLTAQCINDFPKRGLVRGSVPKLLWALLAKIPNARWQELCACEETISSYIIRQVDARRAEISSGKVEAELDASSKSTLLARLLRHKIDGVQITDKDVTSELMGHTIAGVDTSSTTASYLCWELSRRPEVMRKLQAEIDNAMPDPHSIPDIQVLQRIPYLDACIKEVLRVYGAAPSALPRVVPSGGAKICGLDIPAGTTVTTTAWSMHRAPGVFEDANSFNPDRWMANTDNTSNMLAHCIPFGYGQRTCGGQNLALLMLKILTVSLVRNFDIVADKATDENSMFVCDAFVIFPWAGVCKLAFNPRSQKE